MFSSSSEGEGRDKVIQRSSRFNTFIRHFAIYTIDLSSQPPDILSPQGSTLGSPTAWTCLGNIQRKMSRRHPDQPTAPHNESPIWCISTALVPSLPKRSCSISKISQGVSSTPCSLRPCLFVWQPADNAPEGLSPGMVGTLDLYGLLRISPCGLAPEEAMLSTCPQTCFRKRGLVARSSIERLTKTLLQQCKHSWLYWIGLTPLVASWNVLWSHF